MTLNYLYICRNSIDPSVDEEVRSKVDYNGLSDTSSECSVQSSVNAEKPLLYISEEGLTAENDAVMAEPLEEEEDGKGVSNPDSSCLQKGHFLVIPV